MLCSLYINRHVNCVFYSIRRLHEMMNKNVDLFDQRWNKFITNLREDNNTVNSWYLLGLEK